MLIGRICTGGGVAMDGRRGPGRELTARVLSLTRAKEALERELEANLKQLRSILKESQRIAEELEAVLRETRSPLEPNGDSGETQRRGQKEQPGRKEHRGQGGGTRYRLGPSAADGFLGRLRRRAGGKRVKPGEVEVAAVEFLLDPGAETNRQGNGDRGRGPEQEERG